MQIDVVAVCTCIMCAVTSLALSRRWEGVSLSSQKGFYPGLIGANAGGLLAAGAKQ